MKTAREFRDYMQSFIGADFKPAIKDLDIQVYNRDRLTVTIGYKSMIPSIMFQISCQEDKFCVYIATTKDENGPNQNKRHCIWELNETISALKDKCIECVNIQEITSGLLDFNPNSEG